MKKHLVIAAAGTGGHVMPGIAVAEIMISRGWDVSCWHKGRYGKTSRGKTRNTFYRIGL